MARQFPITFRNTVAVELIADALGCQRSHAFAAKSVKTPCLNLTNNLMDKPTYKSVSELAAEHINLAEYTAQIEREYSRAIEEISGLRSALRFAVSTLEVARADHENRGDYYDGYCSSCLREIREMNVL